MKLRHLLCLVPALGLIVACDGGSELVGVAAEDCGTAPLFTVLPVALSDIHNITVVGGVDAPGHVVPTAQAGFILATEGASLFAPSAMQITKLRRARYLVSPSRQGKTDYALDFQICKQISGWLGHVVTISSAIPEPVSAWDECPQYSTATERIEACTVTLKSVTISAGERLGTAGMSIALGLMGLDFGVLDSRVNNGYFADWRFPDASRQAVCGWEKFEPGLRDMLYSKLGDLGRPFITPGGEPRCGTMKVDVAGTLKGVWAPPGVTTPLAGSEEGYLALVNYPYRPETELALSLGAASVGGLTAIVPRANAGRVNRAFEQVTSDGLIYCYGPDPRIGGRYWLMQLTSPTTLSVRQFVSSAVNICQAPPDTWSMAGAENFVR